jgi:hydrogenase maturation factor
MFDKKMSDVEKKLFLLISLPMLKGRASEEVKGRLLYALKTGKLSDEDLKAAFPEEYAAAMELIRQKPSLAVFDKRNYILEYFLRVHNARAGCKVVPAQIIGMRAERKDGKNAIAAKVRYADGTVENLSVTLFENFDMRINLSDYVLVHNGTVCHKLTKDEYGGIVGASLALPR